MERQYWLGRWERGETGWHQQEVEPALITHFSALKPTRVFVPLCGRSRDLAWLVSRGHEVLGVELSPLACQEFLSENQIPCSQTTEGEFTVYRGKGLTLFNGDFFALAPEQLGEIGAVYDRAALIALPPELRIRYAARMIELLRACAGSSGFRLLQIALERTPQDPNGPPFSVQSEEIQRLYGREFHVSLLSRERLNPAAAARPNAASQVDECVYLLTREAR